MRLESVKSVKLILMILRFRDSIRIKDHSVPLLQFQAHLSVENIFLDSQGQSRSLHFEHDYPPLSFQRRIHLAGVRESEFFLFHIEHCKRQGCKHSLIDLRVEGFVDFSKNLLRGLSVFNFLIDHTAGHNGCNCRLHSLSGYIGHCDAELCFLLIKPDIVEEVSTDFICRKANPRDVKSGNNRIFLRHETHLHVMCGAEFCRQSCPFLQEPPTLGCDLIRQKEEQQSDIRDDKENKGNEDLKLQEENDQSGNTGHVHRHRECKSLPRIEIEKEYCKEQNKSQPGKNIAPFALIVDEISVEDVLNDRGVHERDRSPAPLPTPLRPERDR